MLKRETFWGEESQAPLLTLERKYIRENKEEVFNYAVEWYKLFKDSELKDSKLGLLYILFYIKIHFFFFFC